jgi:tetratricopeptide (TPR) repeat protein
MPDVLARDVELLCAEFEQPGHRNVGFVVERLRDLLAAGHRLVDIESALRRGDAPIFLVGLPLTAEDKARFGLFHPDDSVDHETLRFSLWIGIDGRDEVDQVLAEASISTSENLANLNVTGLLTEKSEGPALPSDPTARELLEWLLLDAPTWTERRVAIHRHLDLLATGEAVHIVDELAGHADLPLAARPMITTVRDFLRRLSEDGPTVAFQNCEPLVADALYVFLAAPTWAAASDVYRSYQDELSGDLATEILMRMAGESWYTVAQRDIINAHWQVLEWAWERGIEAASAAAAEQQFPVKFGTPAAEDHLLPYLAAPDLEAARDVLRTAPEELFQLDHEALVEGMRRADTDDEVWRVGLFEDTRDRGVDEAYRDWAGLSSIESSADNDQAIELLTELLARHQRCLRDRTLELLLAFHARAGHEQAQRKIAQELVDHRSACSPPGRRTLDLVNLGIICSQQGELVPARAVFREARMMIVRLRDPAARGLAWLRVGIFSRDYDEDLPTAVHSFRAAVEEFRRARDLVSIAYAFEELSSVCRSLERTEQAYMYASFAQRSMADLDGNDRGAAGGFADVEHRVEKGIAQTEFLIGEFATAADRLEWLLNQSLHRPDDDERLILERIALACAIQSRTWHTAREILTSWYAAGLDDWAALGRVAIALGESAADDSDRMIDPACAADLAGFADTLARLGASPAEVEGLLRPSPLSELSEAVIDILADVHRADPLMPSRLFGDYEASAWATRSDRAATTAHIMTPGRVGYIPLPPGAPWPDIIARYHDLGVWELPDLAVLGPAMDRWSLLSRFEDAIRINQAAPSEGSLDIYFFRSDPEGHLDRSVRYIPDSELIVCSLPYLDDLFRIIGSGSREAEIEHLNKRLKESDWGDATEDIATSVVNMMFGAPQGFLLEWVIAHEIGHAHHGHAAASPGRDELALEEQADSFFLDGVLADYGLPEILMAVFGTLNSMYVYDCEKQFNRPPTPDELRDRSLLLNAAPDASGHRPLVFRAVALVQSILRKHPELDTTRYIDKFAESLEGR